MADYDGSYAYGCGTTIDQSKANYYLGGGHFCNPLGLSSYPYTSPVDYHPHYGYGMNDMAGSVWEWTSSCYYSNCSPNSRVVRGGSWYDGDYYCTVSGRGRYYPYDSDDFMGFRVCR